MTDLAPTASFLDELPTKNGGAQQRNTGILPYQTLRELARAGLIKAAPEDIAPDQFQPASLDLRLGRQAYRVRASFLPGRGASVMDKVRQFDGYPIDLSAGYVLEKGGVYVIQLQEAVKLVSGLVGYANPKSSTGRLDILTRLISDGGVAFDQVDRGYDGPLYLEVAPRTFSVVVRQGARLNQLRLQRGDARIAAGEMERQYRAGNLVRPFGDQFPRNADNLIAVTIDLEGKGAGDLIGFKAQKFTDRIELDKVGYYNPQDFWEPIYNRGRGELTLYPDDFYILVTREEVAIPPEFAAEMVPYHTRSGEYRVHYAGFFDPGFGHGPGAASKAVLEVRSHEVPFVLEHGQTVGWLKYERLAGTPDRVYGKKIGSNYQSQGLALGKQFKRFT
jgi:dCTP deaminase